MDDLHVADKNKNLSTWCVWINFKNVEKMFVIQCGMVGVVDMWIKSLVIHSPMNNIIH